MRALAPHVLRSVSAGAVATLAAMIHGPEKPSTIGTFSSDSRILWWLLGVACGVSLHPVFNVLGLELPSQPTASSHVKGWMRRRDAEGVNSEAGAIPHLALGIDRRFWPKAEELSHRIATPAYPTFEELYSLIVNQPYSSHDNIWNTFPNAYAMRPSFQFPFSNLRPEHVENVLSKLARPPKLAVEVGSFHGHSAIMTASILDKHNFRQTPLLCIDPWTGDLGELLYRNEWQNKLTPGEIKDGRSTSYFQFMINVKSKIQDGTIGARHILPLAVTSEVGARYLTALKVTPDFVYLDSAHEQDMTYMELTLYYAVLAKGGIIFGDDFSWDSVSRDVTRFAAEKKLNLQLDGVTWMLQKA